jgi:hypothetical protein
MPAVRRAIVTALVLCVYGHAAADPATGVAPPPAVVSDPAPASAAPAAPSIDHPLHILSPSSLTTDGGSVLRLPPGQFLSDAQWSKLDLEMRRLQDAETRLTAENTSFRQSAAAWTPPWWLLAGAAVSGITLGWYAHDKL